MEDVNKLLRYGPEGPPDTHQYDKFPTPKYLTGYAKKIEKDLKRVARMYNGKEIIVYKLTGKHRCTVCTDSITGARLSSQCRECNGTGKVDAWEKVGSFWAYIDFGPRYTLETPIGTTTNPGNDKDTFIIIGCPLLAEQDFFVTKETKEVFKIFNVEPRIIAMGGHVVAQAAMASYIEDGSPMYRVIDW